MGIMTIDGQAIEFTDEPNVLSVIRKAGIDIPTLYQLAVSLLHFQSGSHELPYGAPVPADDTRRS